MTSTGRGAGPRPGSTRTVPPRGGPLGVLGVLLGCTAIALVPLGPGPARAAELPAGTTAEPSPSTVAAEPAPSAVTAEPAPSTTVAEPTPSTTVAEPTAPTAAPEPTPPTATAEPTSSTTTGVPSASATPSATPEPTPGPVVTTPGPQVPGPATPGGGPAVVVERTVAAVLDAPGAAGRYLEPDAPLGPVPPLSTIRVRFLLRNTTAGEVDVTPRLEVRPEGSGGYTEVPATAVPGSPFHVVHEWVRLERAPGTEPGPAEQVLGVPQLLLVAGAPAVPGRRDMAANPATPITLPAATCTEQEFTLRVGVDARAGAGYQFRLTDDGASLAAPSAPGAAATTGTLTVRVTVVPAATSPGQRRGRDEGPPPSERVAGVSSVRYALAAAADPAADPVHGPYPVTSDRCATCHGAHTGRGPGLLVAAGSSSTLCFACHDGTGAGQDVRAAYADPSVPPNDPASGSYTSHDVVAGGPHTIGAGDEFGGVDNRHSGCADCHNPHRAGADPAVQTPDGWTAPGRLSGVPGVAVTNGAAGTDPGYTFLDGRSTSITFEYQLCLRCHSGNTVLPSRTGLPPSRRALDKGVEFNPANASFHPVEAAGTNRTQAMAASLAGTSPYKLWDFAPDSTIRCTHCHAGSGSAAADPGATGVDAGADLSPHISPNEGILLRPYRDRVLPSAAEAYSAGDFALCYVCHAEAPFTGSSNAATNFRYHGMHTSHLSDEGHGGTDIDVPGAGQGNALCAECHYRIHGSGAASGGQDVTGARLVNFAPDVTPNNGVISWRPGSGGGAGTCTLTCHGERHDGERY